jgi:hypothetical protein
MIENRSMSGFFQYSNTPTLQYSNTPVLFGNVSGMPGPPTDCDEEIT